MDLHKLTFKDLQLFSRSAAKKSKNNNDSVINTTSVDMAELQKQYREEYKAKHGHYPPRGPSS